jgi:uncharacterized membrane protein (GlpM family)
MLIAAIIPASLNVRAAFMVTIALEIAFKIVPKLHFNMQTLPSIFAYLLVLFFLIHTVKLESMEIENAL